MFKKALLSTASVAAMSAVTTADAAIMNPGNGHYYELHQEILSWEDAQNYALSQGGYLATVTSESENNFISNNFSFLQAWLGGSDAGSEGDWFWVTGPEAGTQFWENGKGGDPVGGAYTNWAPLQPDNFLGVQDYLAMNNGGILTDPGTWDDRLNDFTGKLWSIIEYDSDPNAVPEPTAAALALLGLAGLGVAARRRKRKSAA